MAYDHGAGTVTRHNKMRDSVLVLARSVGIAGDVEAMQLALAAMIGGYDKAMETLPKGSQARLIVEAAFGNSERVAREILEAV
jgi:hypothetical protein